MNNAPDIKSGALQYFFCLVPLFSAILPIRESEPTLCWELQL